MSRMGTNGSAFWDDLARDLEDPEFRREYIVESIRVATIDRLMNELDEARRAAGLSKAALARAIRTEPAVVRRLFSSSQVNPTLGTLTEVAAALGMRITLEPLQDAEREHVTAPLLDGRAADTRALAEYLDHLRHASATPMTEGCVADTPARARLRRDNPPA
jgi:DNA-binding phage protein